jgi:hypothetical protein
MAGDPKALALEACDDALKDSVSNISSVLLNAFISAKTDKARQDAMEKARKGVMLSKDTHTAMRGVVDAVFT